MSAVSAGSDQGVSQQWQALKHVSPILVRHASADVPWADSPAAHDHAKSPADALLNFKRATQTVEAFANTGRKPFKRRASIASMDMGGASTFSETVVRLMRSSNRSTYRPDHERHLFKKKPKPKARRDLPCLTDDSDHSDFDEQFGCGAAGAVPDDYGPGRMAQYHIAADISDDGAEADVEDNRDTPMLQGTVSRSSHRPAQRASRDDATVFEELSVAESPVLVSSERADLSLASTVMDEDEDLGDDILADEV